MTLPRFLAILLFVVAGQAASAFEGCKFSFRIDTQSSALQALIQGASERGGFWRPIAEAPDDVQEIGRYIGRLDVCLMTPDGKPRTVTVGGRTRTLKSPQMTTCTAALLPGNRLLTNSHCFYNDVMVEAGFTFVQEARINFGYTAADFTGNVKTYAVSTRELARDADLDAMVLQIFGADANEALGGHVPMVMQPRVRPRRALTMIHHPNGDPQQFSSGTCQVHPDQAKLPEAASQLRHSCETTGGSSGSLLLDARSLAVVGLHNQGGLHGRGGYNGGHKIAAVEAALGLGFKPRRGPELRVDPEAEAQAALSEALAAESMDARRSALEAVLARFPDSRAATSARFTLGLLTPKMDPEAEARAALTDALQVAGLAARRQALETVASRFPNSPVAASARNTLALMAPNLVSREEQATARLLQALSANDDTTRRSILREIIRDFDGTAVARTAASMAAKMADKPKTSMAPQPGPVIESEPADPTARTVDTESDVIAYKDGVLDIAGMLTLDGSRRVVVQRITAKGKDALKPLKIGDVITSIDGEAVSSTMDAYLKVLRAIRAGQGNTVLYVPRNGYGMTVSMPLPKIPVSASDTARPDASVKRTPPKKLGVVYSSRSLSLGKTFFEGANPVRIVKTAYTRSGKAWPEKGDQLISVGGTSVTTLRDLKFELERALESSQPAIDVIIRRDGFQLRVTLPLTERQASSTSVSKPVVASKRAGSFYRLRIEKATFSGMATLIAGDLRFRGRRFSRVTEVPATSGLKVGDLVHSVEGTNVSGIHDLLKVLNSKQASGRSSVYVKLFRGSEAVVVALPLRAP